MKEPIQVQVTQGQARALVNIRRFLDGVQYTDTRDMIELDALIGTLERETRPGRPWSPEASSHPTSPSQ